MNDIAGYPISGYGMVEEGGEMKLKIWLLGLGMCLAAGSAFASKDEVVVKAQDKEDFAAQAAAIHKLMEAGGRYEFVTSEERAAVDSRFSDMQTLFDKYDTTDKMDKDTKIRLLNDQEAINGILAKRDNNRVICERAAPTGSLLPKSTCRTYGEIERSRRDSQKFMQDTATHAVQNRNGG